MSVSSSNHNNPNTESTSNLSTIPHHEEISNHSCTHEVNVHEMFIKNTAWERDNWYLTETPSVHISVICVFQYIARCNFLYCIICCGKSGFMVFPQIFWLLPCSIMWTITVREMLRTWKGSTRENCQNTSCLYRKKQTWTNKAGCMETNENTDLVLSLPA